MGCIVLHVHISHSVTVSVRPLALSGACSSVLSCEARFTCEQLLHGWQESAVLTAALASNTAYRAAKRHARGRSPNW